MKHHSNNDNPGTDFLSALDLFSSESSETKCDILIVDDDKLIRKILADALKETGYKVFEASNGIQALEMALGRTFGLILCDLMMPEMTGLEFLKMLRGHRCGTEVIMITAFQDLNSAISAMKFGAGDFITKPFSMSDLRRTVDEALQRVEMKKITNEFNNALKRKVEAQEDRLRILFYEAIQTMINAIEAKDDYTKGHSIRVTRYAMWLVKELELDFEKAKDIHLAAQLHDIGKLNVPDTILNKPGPLTEAEFAVIRQHPEKGCMVLAPILSEDNLKIIMHHHERWTGKGYPMSLREDEIPLGSRVIALADSLDAMTSQRSYRDPVGITEALEEIRRGAGEYFDPELIEPFITAVEKNTEYN